MTKLVRVRPLPTHHSHSVKVIFVLLQSQLIPLMHTSSVRSVFTLSLGVQRRPPSYVLSSRGYSQVSAIYLPTQLKRLAIEIWGRGSSRCGNYGNREETKGRVDHWGGVWDEQLNCRLMLVAAGDRIDYGSFHSIFQVFPPSAHFL